MLKPPYTCYDRLYVYHLDITVPPEIHQPDFIGAWQEGETIVLFFHRDNSSFIKALCRKLSCSIVYQADLDYSEWEAGVEIKPFTIHGLTVSPVWCETDADITLDPSVIFGSGFHPTTQLCLESLLSLLDNNCHPVNSVFDLGCGTGLLAIAAAQKGAKTVTAYDYNSLACQVAQANAQNNSVSITVNQADLLEDSPDTGNIDLVLANLHHELMIELFKRPSFWQASYYILSGFFVSREEMLLIELPDGFRFVERKSRSKWAVWVLQKKS